MPKRTTSIRGNRNNAGFTFVEIIMALAIGAGLFGFALSYVGGSPVNRMRQESLRLIRVIRYAYYQAASRNSYYRITFDLDAQSYLVESSGSTFAVVKEGDEKEEMRRRNEEKESQSSGSSGEVAAPPAPTGFAEAEDEGLGPMSIPKNIRLSDMQVMHQKEKSVAGKSYLYFFPRGQTEFAVIHLIEPPEPGTEEAEEFDIEDIDPEDINAITLIVNPLTGNVDVRREYVEYEDVLNDM